MTEPANERKGVYSMTRLLDQFFTTIISTHILDMQTHKLNLAGIKSTFLVAGQSCRGSLCPRQEKGIPWLIALETREIPGGPLLYVQDVAFYLVFNCR